jgi:VIT1/CCC1 family predicted Fe2+/Mn2+ transporter
MAMGEWVSVQSAREMFMHEIERQRTELRDDPVGERRQLVGIYEAKGLNRREARAVAERVLADPAVALDTMAREELGVDPKTLGGSAWQAAAVTFGIGSVVGVAVG